MKLLFNFLFLAIPTLFIINSCTIEAVENEDEDSEISDEPLTGSLGPDQDFVLGTALVEQSTLFGDQGYDFKLFSSDVSCETGGIPTLLREIDFFVVANGALEVGVYPNSKGPFITTSSFFGCTVEITSVSNSSISGKVKGGDPIGDQWVEGAFTAAICN